MATANQIRLQIEGMDCASCAMKIETAMQRLPGVSDVSVSYQAGTLALKVDQDRTQWCVIEEKVRALGYHPVGQAPETSSSFPARRAKEPWWRGAKAALVFKTGALFVATFLTSLALPRHDA